MPVVRGQFAEFLAPGLNMRTFNAYRERPEIFSQIIKVLNSTRAYEEDFAISGFGPLAPKGELETTILDEPFKLGGVRWIHKKFALGFVISEEMRMFDQYSLMQDLSGALGKSAKYTAELYGHDVLNNGFDTTKYIGRDGKALFAVDHPVAGTGGVLANRPAVDVDLSQAALEAAWANFQTQLDDRGMPILSQPAILLVHPTQELLARRLLGNPSYPGQSNPADPNPLQGWIRVVSSVFLTDTDAWYLLAPPSDIDIRFYWAMRPDTKTWDDDDADATIHKIKQMHSTGFGDWRNTYASPGA
jgi:hypothetical protein